MAASVEKLRRAEQIAKEWGERDAPEALRRLQAAAERNLTMEAKVFTQRDDSVVHWTIDAPNLDDLIGNVDHLMGYLDANKFTAHNGFSSGQSRPPASPARSATQTAQKLPNGHFDGTHAPTCQFCGGDVYDNRNDKRSDKTPDFKCKKKQGCGGAAWINEDGESLYWKK